MMPRFPLTQIPEIAGRYAYALEPILTALVPLVQAQGYLTQHQLFQVCHWKSARRPDLANANTPAFVIEITRFALSATDEQARIAPLRLLTGVECPTASAILHWFCHDQYPILDFRAIWSLQVSEDPPLGCGCWQRWLRQHPNAHESPAYCFTCWLSYVTEWRRLLAQAQQDRASIVITPRMFDRALWKYSDENQTPN